MREFVTSSGGRVNGRITVPGDKSISHRSIMLGALAQGTSRIHGFLEGADCLATMRVFQALGVPIEQSGTEVEVHGVGLHGLQAPEAVLDVGNSGTSMRLLSGVLAAQAFNSELTGDASLRQRPMARVITPLQQMGADIQGRDDGEKKNVAPLTIRGNTQLNPIRFEMPVASAQVKSCLLLAALCGNTTAEIIEPGPSRDHSERMLRAFGVTLEQKAGYVSLRGGQALQACELTVPGDLSSAAFFMVAAAIMPGSDVVLENVGINPTRAGVINVLMAMGADIQLQNQRQAGDEPIADIRIQGGGLRGIEIDPAQVPLAIDEFPALFIAAACAQGTTVLRQAEELRVKESDRIAVMAEGLQELGIAVEVFADGLRIEGGKMQGGTVNSHGDHRIAMSFAVAGLRAQGDIRIQDCANVDTSFPGFVETARAAGLNIREESGIDS